LRILMLSDVAFPRVNGVSTSIQTFRSQLEELGHHTHLVAPAYGQGEADEPGVTRVPARAVPGDPEDRFMNRSALYARAGEILSTGCDLIHVQTPFLAHYAGLTLARRYRVPVVETYHTYFEEYFHHYLPYLPKRLTRFVARQFTRGQAAAVDALVVPTREMLGVLAGYGVTTRVEVIPTGIDFGRFRGGDGAAFRARYGIAPHRPVLAHISRVAHEKNIDFVLRVTARIAQATPEVLLVIAGEGPALEHLKRYAHSLGLARNVLFVGNLAREGALLDCYRAADLFVFASRTETQGLVLLEALALGVPVVSTAVLGTAEVLRGTKGACIAPEDEAGFAAAVIALLADPQARARLAAAGPTDARAWSARAMAERLAALYGELASAARSGERLRQGAAVVR
jgi:1,2-diacylglycerol 3-alpha-glucosyltransferase